MLKLQKELPEVVQEAERYTADSKFFRGLFLILIALTFVLLYNKSFGLSSICFFIGIFSLIRYFHKRQKAVNTLYKGIVFLEKLDNKVSKEKELDTQETRK